MFDDRENAAKKTTVPMRRVITCAHDWRRGFGKLEWCGACFLRREPRNGALVEIRG
jgi:hypothetical protein